ncbi:MAG: ferredoxin [Desulfurella sp.]|uniref:ferredoxin n=1 Tax=Desulfurella TaxID=33001 RepID=UPI000CBF3BDA|nr:ferredoxin [Desulfurella multipotens]PMP64745.1 MAG: 4Fe-4S ferredoxin [Desulfurella multipotens]
MAKVTVDQSTCIGCEVCVDTAPDVFEMVDGKAHVKNPDGAPIDVIKEAAEACPTESIKVEE